MDDMKEMKEMLRAIIHQLEVQGATLEQILTTSNYMQGTINENQKAISDMQSDIRDLKTSNQEIRGELGYIREGQERQDRILEALAARSLEQETSIKELRRAR